MTTVITGNRVQRGMSSDESRRREVFQVCTLTPNFTVAAFKMWTYTGSEIAKIGNFWHKFAPNGV